VTITSQFHILTTCCEYRVCKSRILIPLRATAQSHHPSPSRHDRYVPTVACCGQFGWGRLRGGMARRDYDRGRGPKKEEDSTLEYSARMLGLSFISLYSVPMTTTSWFSGRSNTPLTAKMQLLSTLDNLGWSRGGWGGRGTVHLGVLYVTPVYELQFLVHSA